MLNYLNFELHKQGRENRINLQQLNQTLRRPHR